MSAIKKAVLIEEHERFSSLIQSIPDIVYFKDADLRNLAVNKAFEEMCGLKSADVVGKTDDEIFPPELAAACKASDRLVLESGQSHRFEETTHDRDDREIVYETIKSPLFNTGGKIVGLIGISRNISDRKRTEAALKESEERFRTLYENATIGLYRTTPDGCILLANPALVRMLGFDSFEELAARDLEKGEGGTEYDRAFFRREIEKNGAIRGWEAVWTKKDGAKVHIRESARAIFDESGRVKFYEGTVEDITRERSLRRSRSARENRRNPHAPGRKSENGGSFKEEGRIDLSRLDELHRRPRRGRPDRVHRRHGRRHHRPRSIQGRPPVRPPGKRDPPQGDLSPG